MDPFGIRIECLVTKIDLTGVDKGELDLPNKYGLFYRQSGSWVVLYLTVFPNNRVSIMAKVHKEKSTQLIS